MLTHALSRRNSKRCLRRDYSFQKVQDSSCTPTLKPTTSSNRSGLDKKLSIGFSSHSSCASHTPRRWPLQDTPIDIIIRRFNQCIETHGMITFYLAYDTRILKFELKPASPRSGQGRQGHMQLLRSASRMIRLVRERGGDHCRRVLYPFGSEKEPITWPPPFSPALSSTLPTFALFSSSRLSWDDHVENAGTPDDHHH